jgi:hypothetical protein
MEGRCKLAQRNGMNVTYRLALEFEDIKYGSCLYGRYSSFLDAWFQQWRIETWLFIFKGRLGRVHCLMHVRRSQSRTPDSSLRPICLALDGLDHLSIRRIP